MVHQHFMLVPVMTVTENIVLGGEPRRRGGLLDVREGARRVRELSERYGLAVDPDAVIEDVTVGAQQRVEILKTLYRDAPHPRARRADRGADRAGDRRAVPGAARAARRRRGDRLHQPQARRGAGDRRPRDRAAARQEDRHGADRGRDRAEPRPPDGRARRAAARGKAGRAARRAGARGRGPARARRPRARGGARACRSTVRGGEIVALAGVDGNGQHELVEAIAGLRGAESGSIAIGGEEVCGRGVRADLRRRRGAHRRGPPAARAGARLHAGGEPGPARVPLAAAVARGLAATSGTSTRAPARCSGVRRARRRARTRSPRRCRAATSRRSASRARSPATRSC